MRPNPRSIILRALREKPRTFDQLSRALLFGVCEGGRIVSAHRFARMTFYAEAHVARHLCKLLRSRQAVRDGRHYAMKGSAAKTERGVLDPGLLYRFPFALAGASAAERQTYEEETAAARLRRVVRSSPNTR